MNYIVVDLEWNRAESKARKIKYPITLSGEIIQIGAVKLDENLKEIDEFNMMIKPKFYSKMNKEVEQITSIHNEDLINCLGFPAVIDAFQDWCGDDCVMLTWGPRDVDVLLDNLIIHGLETDWIPEPFDAQLMFDDLETMEGRAFSLDYAVVHFSIKGNKGHDALNDARDTAAVIRHFDVEDWILGEKLYRLEQDEQRKIS